MSLYTWEDIEDLTVVDPIISACFNAYRDRPREEMLIRMVIELVRREARLLELLTKMKMNEPVVIKIECTDDEIDKLKKRLNAVGGSGHEQ